jgi:FlaG/FlaF family flagellin (archaellin)
MKTGMDMSYKKRGVSGIVATVVMIALVMAVSGIVWVVVTNLISEQLNDAGSCLDVLDTVKINNEYTCYNTSKGELMISLGIGDVDIEKVIISVSGSGSSKSYEVGRDDAESSAALMNYTGGNDVKLPGKNEGLTYRINTVTEGLGKPDSIKIYPVANGKQCDSTDSITGVTSCLLLA